MSYSTADTIRAWTDDVQRNPFKYTLTGYMSGSPVGSPVVVYTETEMFSEFARMRALRETDSTRRVYDQIKVERQSIVVPSVTE